VNPTTLAKIVDDKELVGAAGAGARCAGGREFIGGLGRCWSDLDRSGEKLPIADEGAAPCSTSDGLLGVPSWSFMINPILCNSF